MTSLVAAQLFGLLILIAVLFQLALAAGLPWGHLAMGGRFPGRFPAKMRLAAIGQAVILGLLAVIVFVKAGLLYPEFYAVSTKAIWGVVVICLLSFILNLMTPSKWERIIWAPVGLALTVSSIFVAINNP